MLDRVSSGLQDAINALLGARGRGRHPLKTLLSGSLLGHPLHPVITDIAIGGITLAAIFDVVWLVVSGATFAPGAAEVTLAVAILGMLGSFATGWSDWSDTVEKPRSVGLLHGTLNSLALVIAIVSFVFAYLAPSGRSLIAAILTFVAFGLIGFTGYLGGELVFKYGVNVNHTAWEQGNESFEAIGLLTEFPDQQLSRALVNGVPVVVARFGETVYALSATCTHAGGPLDQGTLEPNACVRCPWHGSVFRLKTGAVVDGPATVPEPAYDVQIRDGVVALKRRS